MFMLLPRLLLCSLVYSSNKLKPLASISGATEIFDETVLTNPRSLDYDFSDDLLHVADKHDLYDELLKQLPTFNLYKLGTDRGTTQVPVVTRRWDTWHTVVDSNSELFLFSPTTSSSPLSTTDMKKNFEKEERRGTDERSSLISSVKKMKIDEFPRIVSTPSLQTESFTNTILTSTTPKNSKSIVLYSVFNETRLRLSNLTRKRKEKISTMMSTLSTSSAIPLKASSRREQQQQPREVFRSVTVMGVKKKKFGSTVSPRPGGIWRRGTIIFEDTKPTSTTTTTAVTAVTTTTTATTTTTTALPVRALADESTNHLKEHSSTNQRRSQMRIEAETSLKFNGTHTHSPRHVQLMSIKKDSILKPVVIRKNPEDYKGPTFNCRILNPYSDGVATEFHDSSCPMSYPGFSKDGSCRCYYKVSSRDEYGCANGYLYACKPLWIRSVAV